MSITKNITIKKQARTGSIRWFAEREWIAIRRSYHKLLDDVVSFESTTGEACYYEKCAEGSWFISTTMGTFYPHEKLGEQLTAFIDENEDTLTTDNNIDITITKKE